MKNVFVFALLSLPLGVQAMHGLHTNLMLVPKGYRSTIKDSILRELTGEVKRLADAQERLASAQEEANLIAFLAHAGLLAGVDEEGNQTATLPHPLYQKLNPAVVMRLTEKLLEKYQSDPNKDVVMTPFGQQAGKK